MQRWLAWWETNRQVLDLRRPLPRRAYTLVLHGYLRLDPRTVPVVCEDDRMIVWRSTNLCPTLAAYYRPGLDTRIVCCAATEGAAQALLARLDPRLRVSCNYAAGIRPHADYCEEQIALLD